MRICMYGGTREVQLVLANLCNDVTCMRVSVMYTISHRIMHRKRGNS